jgi:hypothetical protein
LTTINVAGRTRPIFRRHHQKRMTMNQRAAALRTAIVIGLLCAFALGRVAYAAHQCYRLVGGGCGGGIERVIDVRHAESQQTGKVCAQEMEAPDDRGSSVSLTHAASAAAAAPALTFVPAPQFQPPRAVNLTPPPTRVSLLTSFGRLRL